MQDVSTRSLEGPTPRQWLKTLLSRVPLHKVWVIAGVVLGLLVGLIMILDRGGTGVTLPPRHPAAIDHVPGYIASPGSPDILLGVMAAVLAGAVLGAGVLFFWLHSLPERLVHKSTKVHLDIVAALALLSLFTHMHIFWVAALLIALVKIPDFSFLTRHLNRITASLERIADAPPRSGETNSGGPVGAASHGEHNPC
jgi:hypothetical protein